MLSVILFILVSESEKSNTEEAADESPARIRRLVKPATVKRKAGHASTAELELKSSVDRDEISTPDNLSSKKPLHKGKKVKAAGDLSVSVPVVSSAAEETVEDVAEVMADKEKVPPPAEAMDEPSVPSSTPKGSRKRKIEEPLLTVSETDPDPVTADKVLVGPPNWLIDWLIDWLNFG